MRHLLFSLLSLLFLHTVWAQQLSVMTYNIRLNVASDGENAWPNRKDFLAAQIKFNDPDIIGIQEGLPGQVEDMKSMLKEYAFIGQGRDGGNNGEYSALFYKTGKFSLLEQGTFWLSDTPAKVSKGWDAAFNRICTYGLFKTRKGHKKFWVFNTHLDHQGEEARNKGMELIINKIAELSTKNYPVILTGDFNSEPSSELIANLNRKMSDTYKISVSEPFGPVGTFNGFQFCEPVTRRIDYIFISDPSRFKVLKYAVLTDSNDMKYPSDHFPVLAQIQIK